MIDAGRRDAARPSTHPTHNWFMKKISTLSRLGLIVGTSVTLELLTWVLGAFSVQGVVRLLVLAILLALMLNGSRLARYALSVLYFLGGVLMIVAALRAGTGPVFAVVLGALAIFYVVSAGFFLRSRALQAMVAAKSPERLAS
jgi:predicted membrane channel-forming protein YqfA (hemolysin III family)